MPVMSSTPLVAAAYGSDSVLPPEAANVTLLSPWHSCLTTLILKPSCKENAMLEFESTGNPCREKEDRLHCPRPYEGFDGGVLWRTGTFCSTELCGTGTTARRISGSHGTPVHPANSGPIEATSRSAPRSWKGRHPHLLSDPVRPSPRPGREGASPYRPGVQHPHCQQRSRYSRLYPPLPVYGRRAYETDRPVFEVRPKRPPAAPCPAQRIGRRSAECFLKQSGK